MPEIERQGVVWLSNWHRRYRHYWCAWNAGQLPQFHQSQLLSRPFPEHREGELGHNRSHRGGFKN